MQWAKLLGLLLAFLMASCGTTSDPESELTREFKELAEAHERIEFIDIKETTTNNYVVKLRVDDTAKVTKDSNARAENLALTKKWTDMVCTYEVNQIAKDYSIDFLSVHQLDSAGETHSIALCG